MPIDELSKRKSGLLVLEADVEKKRAAKRQQEEQFGPLEIRDEDKRERLGEMMAEILHMGGFRTGAIHLPPDTKPVIKARRRLWRHFADELLGTDWCCEELC